MIDLTNGRISDDQIIWHYRAFANFVWILQNKALRFSCLNELRDPCEGRFEDDLHKSKLMRAYESKVREGWVNCWTIDDEESDLMWYAYAPDFGVAIKSTKGALKEAVRLENKDAYIGKVRYGTDWAAGSSEDPYDNAFLKRRHFSREEELRIYVATKSEYPEDEPQSKVDSGGIAVPADLSKLMQALWVSPHAPRWFLQVAKSELANYGFGATAVETRPN